MKDRIRSVSIMYQFLLSRYSVQNTASELLCCHFLHFIMSQLAVKLQDEGCTPYSPHAQFLIVCGLLPQPVVMGIY